MSVETLERTATISAPLTAELITGIAVVLMHTSKDKFTPVIGAVAVSSRTFVATDRYTIGEWEHTPGAADDAPILLPRVSAEWLTKQAPGSPNNPLTVTFTPDSVTITTESGAVVGMISHEVVGGNYPPVARLFEGAKPTAGQDMPFNLAPQHLDRFVKGAARVVKGLKRDAGISFQHTESTSSKAGPLIVTLFHAPQFRALMQPMMKLR